MDRYKTVSKEEFDAFISSYPRPLERDLVMFCEPPVSQFNDFTLGNWPESVVAFKKEIWGANYKPTGKFEYGVLASMSTTPSEKEPG